MLSKMAAAAASSTLRNVGNSHLKVLSSSGIVTRKQSSISKLLHDRRSTLDLKTLSKRGTIDKTVRDSILGAAIGLGVAVVGIPAAVGVLGFGAAGITAGSIGAKMMSAAAIANGGGVASGGAVAILQSIGAAGVPTAVSAATTATGAVLGALKNIYS